MVANMWTDYTGEFSLVQSNNFTTMFLLSRNQHPDEKVIDVSAFFRTSREDSIANQHTQTWIARAGLLGTDLSQVVKTDQTDCLFT